MKVFMHMICISYKSKMHLVIEAWVQSKSALLHSTFKLTESHMMQLMNMSNGRQYSNGGNEMFCESNKDIFETKCLRQLAWDEIERQFKINEA